ncbi:Transposon Ty3-I Gag-Pol polyprotein like [Argiope bruennichi]|uniref:RNA-directed DNA polymerase n=1 Tax=Argiope bruennichi TaxID=94029 RepID=A0A8T0FXQ2_ARGBR|nr:Transposon Ty3-I Gag-Pol polyprotein like [Argiope bruennichi]
MKKREVQATIEEMPLFGLDTEERHSCRILALEDITVPSRVEFVAEGHVSNIRRVLTILREAHLKLSPTKCKLFRNLGHVISSEGVSTDPEKTHAIRTPVTRIGAVLSQKIDGEKRVITYFSKNLSKAERNYCVTLKELLAIIKAVEHFHHYLYGRKFLLELITRHWSGFQESGRTARWVQRLQKYDKDIQHRKGTSHGNANALSRGPCPENCKHGTKVEEKFGVTAPAIRRATSDDDPWSDANVCKSHIGDKVLKPIIDLMEASNGKPMWQDVAHYGPELKKHWAMWDSLYLRNGVLFRKCESDDGKKLWPQIVLPHSRVSSVLEELCSSPTGGYFWIMKNLHNVRERFFWVKSKSNVEKWCRSCNACAKTRIRGKLQKYNVEAPFERNALDVLGPLPRTADGNKYILVIMDYFSK